MFVRTKSRQSETVSQILQQTAGAGTASARVQLPLSMTEQSRPSAVQSGSPKVSVPKTPGNMRWISSLGQTRFVMPSDKGIVITQLPSESGLYLLLDLLSLITHLCCHFCNTYAVATLSVTCGVILAYMPLLGCYSNTYKYNSQPLRSDSLSCHLILLAKPSSHVLS